MNKENKIKEHKEKKEKIKKVKELDITKKTTKYILLGIWAVSFLVLTIGLFIPYYKNINFFNVFNNIHKNFVIQDVIMMATYALIYIISFIILLIILIRYLSDSTQLYDTLKNSLKLLWIFLLLFSLGDIGCVVYFKFTNSNTFPYFIIIFILYTVCYMSTLYLLNKAGILINIYENSLITMVKGVPKIKKKFKNVRMIPMIFVAIFSAITFFTFYLNIISIDNNIVENGYKMIIYISSHSNLEKIIASCFVILLSISFIIFLLTLILKIADYKEFYFFEKVAIAFNFVVVAIYAIIGLFIKFDFSLFQGQLSYNVNSGTANTQSYFGIIIYVVVLIIFLFANKISLNYDLYKRQLFSKMRSTTSNDNLTTTGSDLSNNVSNLDIVPNFDPCPAFSEIDNKKLIYEKNLSDLKEKSFKSMTLQNLVDFILEYAANSPKHLSYTKAEISTFIAGLGASKLTILQGMSGTGKTSLPKIVAEAICGMCNIVEVESSWRDKNELLGYYNEFSKKYTPKKFTQFLYEATLNKQIIDFIVLDEMNLSRIEYYFSDFLSLMEADEDKRQIKLLDVQLFKTQELEENENIDNTALPIENTEAKEPNNGTLETTVVPNQTQNLQDKKQKIIEYLGLVDGHTIMVPKNVWFIGTANRDESTFEISDKVYDRAQTMNFDKRAQKIKEFSKPIPAKYVSYDSLRKLFDEALKQEYDAESDELIMAVEKILLPYRISFGNRVLKQIEEFVKIYMACNDTSSQEKAVEIKKEAVENILYSKVVRKLELKQIENKRELHDKFANLGLKKCCEFIDTLVEE